MELGAGALLLVRTDGPSAEVDARAIAASLRALGGVVDLAPDAEAGERLFDIRRAFHGALAAAGRSH